MHWQPAECRAHSLRVGRKPYLVSLCAVRRLAASLAAQCSLPQDGAHTLTLSPHDSSSLLSFINTLVFPGHGTQNTYPHPHMFTRVSHPLAGTYATCLHCLGGGSYSHPHFSSPTRADSVSPLDPQHDDICVLNYLRLLRNPTILKIIAIPRNVALTTLKLFSTNPEIFEWNVVHRSQVAEVRPLPFPIIPIILLVLTDNLEQVMFVFKAGPRGGVPHTLSIACARIGHCAELTN